MQCMMPHAALCSLATRLAGSGYNFLPLSIRSGFTAFSCNAIAFFQSSIGHPCAMQNSSSAWRFIGPCSQTIAHNRSCS